MRNAFTYLLFVLTIPTTAGCGVGGDSPNALETAARNVERMRAQDAVDAFLKANGTLPDSFDELIPEYLPAVPVTDDGVAYLHYDPETGHVRSNGDPSEQPNNPKHSNRESTDFSERPADNSSRDTALNDLVRNALDGKPVTPEAVLDRGRDLVNNYEQLLDEIDEP